MLRFSLELPMRVEHGLTLLPWIIDHVILLQNLPSPHPLNNKTR